MGRGRGRKWSVTEDDALVRAYVAVSEDPIHGTEQKSTTFWSAIHTRFMEACRSSDNGARSDQALRNRWQSVSHDIAEFVGCWSIITSRNESGKNADDVVKDARALFASQQGTMFAFESCWQILRNVPKYMAGFENQQKRRRHNQQNDELNGVTDEGSENRPGGRKKAKAEKK